MQHMIAISPQTQNSCIAFVQRRYNLGLRRRSNIVQMSYKCFALTEIEYMIVISNIWLIYPIQKPGEVYVSLFSGYI